MRELVRVELGRRGADRERDRALAAAGVALDGVLLDARALVDVRHGAHELARLDALLETRPAEAAAGTRRRPAEHDERERRLEHRRVEPVLPEVAHDVAVRPQTMAKLVEADEPAPPRRVERDRVDELDVARAVDPGVRHD